MAHVFISYVRENRKAVDRLYAALQLEGIDIWLDRERIKPGERWQSAIKNAIKGGAYFLACFSQAYRSRMKSYMNEELTLAIEELRQHPIDRTWFIPVLLDNCDVPERSIGAGETLRDIQWVNLYDDWEQGLNHIIEVVRLPEKKPGPDSSEYVSENDISDGPMGPTKEKPIHQKVSATERSRDLLEAAKLSERYGDTARAMELVRRVSETEHSNTDIMLQCAKLNERYGDTARAMELVRRVSEIH